MKAFCPFTQQECKPECELNLKIVYNTDVSHCSIRIIADRLYNFEATKKD